MMNYNTLIKQAAILVADQPNITAVYANVSAFVFQSIEKLNWVGFYLYDGKNLTVGPFQGKVACSVIVPGAGVCGTAYLEQKTQVIFDVHAIDNHIACDPLSNSEVVIPLIVNNKVIGVFDIDSPIIGRFDDELVLFLETIAQLIVDYLNKSS